MNAVFADSFYFLSLLSEKDTAHAKAVSFSNSYRGRLVTTEWVLVEVGDAFSKNQWRRIFLELLEPLQRNSQVTIVVASHELFERAVQLFSKRPDKDWSLTDCTSFLVMEDYAIAEALTADRHFSQTGFVPLFDA